MSGIYTVLARKWRPHRFDDVVGQDVIVRTLKNAIERNRVAHAYLFAGSRGTGKTTIARILARALNCERGPTSEPCGECASCKSILAGTSLDVLEIDGASTRGIDDIRQLRGDVKLASTGGRKKVYIIDEVHMLTPPAFNALLKTLEEPPAHVIFVLATTDPQKVPETILSRCQRFNFARIRARAAVGRLRTVVDGEGLSISDDALMILARRSGGALRDALGFLDQAVSTGVEPIDEEAVVEILGLVGSDLYLDLLWAFADRVPAKALELVWEVHRQGFDLEFFVQGLLEHLRNLLVLKSAPGMEELLEVSAEEKRRLVELAGRLELGDLVRLIRITVEIGDQIRRSDYPWMHLEVGAVEMASLDSVKEIGELIGELRALSEARAPSVSDRAGGGRRGDEAVETPPPQKPSRRSEPGRRERASASSGPAAVQTTATVGAAVGVATATRTETYPVPEVWERVLERIKGDKPLLWSVLSQGEPGPIEGGAFNFRIDPSKGFHLEQLKEPAHVQMIEARLSEAAGHRMRFRVQRAAGAGESAVPAKERPKVLEDPFVKKVLELLDGEIVG